MRHFLLWGFRAITVILDAPRVDHASLAELAAARIRYNFPKHMDCYAQVQSVDHLETYTAF